MVYFDKILYAYVFYDFPATGMQNSDFLAHFRLIGELIVYTGIRPASGRRLSVNISKDISSEAVRPILSIFHI